MARIVAVHGIGQQLKGPQILLESWQAPMRDGLSLAGARMLDDDDLVCAFYGDAFRRRGKGVGEPRYRAADVEDGFERELLDLWTWQTAGESELPRTKIRTPSAVQRALNALSRVGFFVGLTEQALIGSLKQVHRYFTDPEIRAFAVERVAACVGADTRVMVGHSLGSVVAYEALCEHPEWSVKSLVTLGSPLGIQNLIFDRLRPPPQDRVGWWPGGVEAWTNIADAGDVVALVKTLRGPFGEKVVDILVHNGAKAHDVSPYLTAAETGRAIAAGLAT